MQASFNPVSSEQPRYRSGAVARMVRIPVATLRIWERRYQVVGPALTPSGHRLYSGADVERLLVIKQLVDQGHAIGSLASLAMPSLLEIADARAVLSAPADTSPPVRTRAALIGLGLPRRLGAIAVQRVAVWADLAAADQWTASQPVDAEPLRAELLVAELATLQPESANRLLALMRQLGAEHAVVVYAFGPDVVAERLRRAGCSLHRAPMDDAALRALVSTLCAATTGLPRVMASGSGAPVPLGGAGQVPPRRFDDDTLVQLAAASGTMACECPRHVAELISQLASFEQYSQECLHRSSEDAHLHAHLASVSGSARALFERALEMVAEHEGIVLV
jgi:DNA-binding transcriptional MerR regulator